MNIAAYVRVSSSEQNVANQIPAIREYCAKNYGTEPIIYMETESAWREGRQHELKRLMDEIRSGKRKYDVLVIWALDRLTRLGSAAILNQINTFKAYGVRVVSIQEPWTEAPGELGEILYSIAGWVARMESKRRSERTRAGLDRVKSAGQKLGRPKGSKDKTRRRRSGYHLRYANKGAANFTPETSSVEVKTN